MPESQRTRRSRLLLVVRLAVVVVVAATLAVTRPWDDRSEPDVVVTGTGPLPGSQSGGCAEAYPDTLAQRDFAFDGVVTALRGDLVTFEVREWFRGDGPPEYTIAVPVYGSSQMEPREAPYSVGTRLLVSGEPRWGGAPLDDAVVWSCDFTRYWDQATYEEWSSTFG